MPGNALPERRPCRGGARAAPPGERRDLAEVVTDLRLLSDGSCSVLLERERLLLGQALLELEGLSPVSYTHLTLPTTPYV